jgi:hypothetical protein
MRAIRPFRSAQRKTVPGAALLSSLLLLATAAAGLLAGPLEGASSPLRLVAGYGSEVQADAPGAYWRLGETSGSTATSATGIGHGTYFNGVTLGQGGRLPAIRTRR